MSDDPFRPRVLAAVVAYILPAVVLVPLATGWVPGGPAVLGWLAPILTVVCAATGTAFIIVPMLQHGRRDEALRASGARAVGRVEGVARTGLHVNKVPQLRMSLWILRDGLAPYRGHAVVMADSRLALALGPGASVDVRVDPEDPSAIAFAAVLEPAPLPGLRSLASGAA